MKKIKTFCTIGSATLNGNKAVIKEIDTNQKTGKHITCDSFYEPSKIMVGGQNIADKQRAIHNMPYDIQPGEKDTGIEVSKTRYNGDIVDIALEIAKTKSDLNTNRKNMIKKINYAAKDQELKELFKK